MFTQIKIFTNGINHRSNGYYSAVMATMESLCLWQVRYEHTEVYYQRFEADISTYELAKFTTKKHVELNNTYPGGDNINSTKRFQAMCLLISADSERYSGTWDDLKNSTLLGKWNYPNNPTTAYGILCPWNKPEPQRQVHTTPRAVLFIQSDNTNNGKTVPVNDGRPFAYVTWYRYQEMGHYAGNCPSSTANTRSGSQSLHVVLNMTQKTTNSPENYTINTNWILLNICSTIILVRNIYLVQNIRACDAGKELQAYINGGNQYCS